MYRALKQNGQYKAIPVLSYSTTKTFHPSSSIQEWTVPPQTTQITVDCVASKGADGSGAVGGYGGRVQCILSVTPGQTLYFVVGDIPSAGNVQAYNASDIRTNNAGTTNSTSLNSRLIVAGGGGNCPATTGNSGTTGGAGGGLTGGKAPDYSAGGGYGGTQTAGGAHGVHVSGDLRSGTAGTDGYFGLGGTGGGQGCGGAGWYGGGAGYIGDYRSVGGRAAGGGGGSSYTDSDLCSDVTHTQGYRNGSGYITISSETGIEPITVYKLFKE